jgi:hypothetical protein
MSNFNCIETISSSNRIAVITRIEGRKVFLDVGGLYQAIEDLANFEYFMEKPNVGDMFLYKSSLETITIGKQKNALGEDHQGLT